MARSDGSVGVQDRSLSRRKFQVALRIIAGEYLEFSESVAEKMKSAGLKHCPVECPNETKRIDILRTKYCDECPRTKEMRNFREQTRERWEEWLGDQAADFDFDEMMTEIHRIRNLEPLTDDQITVKVNQLRETYRIERDKAIARRVQTPAAK